MSSKSCLCSPAFMLGMSKSHASKGNNREKLCTGYTSKGHGVLNFLTNIQAHPYQMRASSLWSLNRVSSEHKLNSNDFVHRAHLLALQQHFRPRLLPAHLGAVSSLETTTPGHALCMASPPALSLGIFAWKTLPLKLYALWHFLCPASPKGETASQQDIIRCPAPLLYLLPAHNNPLLVKPTNLIPKWCSASVHELSWLSTSSRGSVTTKGMETGDNTWCST